MRVNDMSRMQNFNINKMMGNDSGKMNPNSPQFEKRFTPIDEPFKAIDWNHMATKSEPEMSDEEFEKAIWEMAWRDAANGVDKSGTPELAKLRSSYVSVVSPDRKAAYNESMSKTGGKMNALHSFYSSDGSKLMHYNSASGFWMPHTTSAELNRMKTFNQTYRQAYEAYEAEYGKVTVKDKGTPQMKEIKTPW